MKKAKILEIWKPRKWEWPHGDVFYIPLKLDNWENITLGKKSESAFTVGDVVCYEVVEEGKKWKEVKENPFKPKAANSESNNRGAMVWMSVKLAFDKVYNDEKDLEKAKKLSREIFNIAMELYNEDKPESNWGEDKSESNENEYQDLPF